MRPWQIWLAFVPCLAVVFGAMGWLTRQTLELDRAEWRATRLAEHEENCGRALWRMDSRLIPMLAEEAARPYFVYQPPRVPRGKSLSDVEPSPLLAPDSEFVLLHFEIHANNELTSPQVPNAELATAQGVAPETLVESARRLEQLRADLVFANVLERLPEQTLPSIEGAKSIWVNTFAPGNLDNNAVSPPPNAPSVAANPKAESNPRSQSPAYSKQQQAVQTYEINQAQPPPETIANAPPSQQLFNVRAPRSKTANDLQNRDAAFQAVAQREVVDQRANWNTKLTPPPMQLVSEGVSRPLWLNGRLLLARRVKIADNVVVQGCWLDWDRIRQTLLADVADLLPQANLEPVTNVATTNVNRLLATLPVHLVAAVPVDNLSAASPIRLSLVIAWTCMLLAATAVGLLLLGVMSLSERRARFVSAVTHELRTPLTTFRMYAEMLAAGMVTDESQRQRYLTTLDAEAQRLTHLVENVLSYARLERGRRVQPLETLSVGGILDRVSARLSERAKLAEMTLAIEADDAARNAVVSTDSTAVEQILFNLVDNACKYAARATDRRIHVRCLATRRHVEFQVEDHGDGLSAKAARQLFRPFSKSVQEAAVSAPGVGLGLALCHRLARDLGGRLRFEPRNSHGATFVLQLPAG